MKVSMITVPLLLGTRKKSSTSAGTRTVSPVCRTQRETDVSSEDGAGLDAERPGELIGNLHRIEIYANLASF